MSLTERYFENLFNRTAGSGIDGTGEARSPSLRVSDMIVTGPDLGTGILRCACCLGGATLFQKSVVPMNSIDFGSNTSVNWTIRPFGTSTVDTVIPGYAGGSADAAGPVTLDIDYLGSGETLSGQGFPSGDPERSVSVYAPDFTETSDASASTSTSYSIGIAQYFRGNISTSGDRDYIAVNLVAGQTYTIAMVGTGALSQQLNDTLLRLRNAGGVQIAENDDGGPGLNSTITITISTTGTYYIDAGAYSGTETGQYSVSIIEGDRASYDVEMGAGVLHRTGSSWNNGNGQPVTVTWGVRDTGPAKDASGNSAPFSQLSAAQIAAMQSSLGQFSDVAGLTFTQVNPGGTTNNATILAGAYTSTTDGAGAYAYFPGSTASTSAAGDVWLNNDSISQTSLPDGSYSKFAVLHELGHAMGLSHPGDYNAAPGQSITYGNNAQFIEDSHQYSVMSYFEESATTTNVPGYPDTLLLYDIYALHEMYGANTSTRTADTTYGYNSNAGGPYDFTSNTSPLLCIWDAGGTDTIDASGYGSNQSIDLRDGHFSSLRGYTDNVSIAFNAVIENAIGGAGNDTITGNSAYNQIHGGAGNDTIDPGAGSAGASYDYLFGEAGDDTYRIGKTSGKVFINVLGEASNGGADKIIFTDLNFSDVTGSYQESGTADGRLLKLSWNKGGGTGEVLIAQDGQFVELYQFADGTIVTGFDISSDVDGTSGNDVLLSTPNPDNFNGFGGVDIASYQNAMAGVTASLLNPGENSGEAAGDIYNSIEGLRGADGNDILSGDDSGNILIDGAGLDTLYGHGGNDTLAFLGGTDTFDGGAGADTADFSGFGHAVWVDLGYNGYEAWTRDADDLNSGTWRKIVDMIGIENLTGTVASDYLKGDAADNVLNGSLGTNTLIGGAGNDTLVYAGGVDVFDGGADSDTADFSKFASAVWIDLNYNGYEAWTRDANDLNSGAWREIVDISRVENLIGTKADDVLKGNSLANVLNGGLGNNSLYGFDGDDRFVYGGGLDAYNGGNGKDVADFSGFNAAVYIDLAATGIEAETTDGENAQVGTHRKIASLFSVETVIGTELIDVMLGSAANDMFIGGGGNDILSGRGGNDQLEGGNGDDTFLYTAGKDVFDGGSGLDTADFSNFGSAIWVDLGYNGYEAWTRDTANLTSGVWREIADTVAVEKVIGTSANDFLKGNNDDNIFVGNSGNDTISGFGGNDILEGGLGNDTISGGLGIDVFLFQAADFASGAVDTITDFHAVSSERDVLRLQGNASNYAFSQQAGGLQVTHNVTGAIINLTNVSLASLTPDQVQYY